MSILNALILGLVQGIAEFLPISSSGHLSVLQNFFHMTTAEEGHMFFDVLLHLGTLISVCVFYRKDIAGIIVDTIGYARTAGHPTPGPKKPYTGARLLLMMVIATLPLVLILPIKDKVEQLYYSTGFIGAAFLITGCLLFISDRMPRGSKTAANMTVKDALIIGVFQAFATVPGLSRSGTTITAGMCTGLDRSFAARFSFLISIPAVLGANILSVADAVSAGIDTSLLPAYLIGTAVAMVSGYFACSLVQYVCSKDKFGRFCYYCFAAGILTIILTIVL